MQDIKIGQEVFIKYKLEVHSCGGSSSKEIYLTKNKAEVAKQDFLNGLRFMVGDLLVFQYREWGVIETYIGRVAEIKYDEKPYCIKTSCKSLYDITDESVVVKIKNDYKAKEENMKVVYVDAHYTSQTCSRCGHIEQSNRNGLVFECKSCAFELHSDLNASRNIEHKARNFRHDLEFQGCVVSHPDGNGEPQRKQTEFQAPSLKSSMMI